MPVSVEGAAESVPSVDIEMRDPQKIYELSGYGKRFSFQEVK